MNFKAIRKQVTSIEWLMSIYIRLKKLWYNKSRSLNNLIGDSKLRFKKYSGTFVDSKKSELAYITWSYHVIEKGLCMPEMKLGFGYERIKDIESSVKKFIGKYGDKNFSSIKETAKVLKEYKEVHERAGFTLSSEVIDSILYFEELFQEEEPSKQQEVSRDVFFANVNSDFKSFSLSRHSIRHFEGSVSLESIIQSIDIAKYAPSACNRQPARVHIITDKLLIQECLSLQNGNRGFGHLADKLLIVTGDISTTLDSSEFFDVYTNVGMFIMNLTYSLHYNRVAHCVLNWYVNSKLDKRLRGLVEIPENEIVINFIVCGGVPDSFKVVRSPRMKTENYYTIH